MPVEVKEEEVERGLKWILSADAEISEGVVLTDVGEKASASEEFKVIG